jgi:hypothetical protein
MVPLSLGSKIFILAFKKILMLNKAGMFILKYISYK